MGRKVRRASQRFMYLKGFSTISATLATAVLALAAFAAAQRRYDSACCLLWGLSLIAMHRLLSQLIVVCIHGCLCSTRW